MRMLIVSMLGALGLLGLLSTGAAGGQATSRAVTLAAPPPVMTATSRAVTLVAPPVTSRVVSRPMTIKYCQGDVDGSLDVGVTDLLRLLAEWGTPGICTDLNDDQNVDVVDLLGLLAGWGRCPG